MENQRKGVIVNISSDYGIIGLTKYLAAYWTKKGIRVNTLCPAGLHNGQDEEFIEKISNLIPMGRMSEPEKYVCTILYMISEASSYMTGATLVLDGGRTIW